MREQLAVLGSPIAHSRSPQLHLAAYRELGLDWDYERIEVTEAELAGFLSGPGRSLRGCSATMPLKTELLRLASEADEVAQLAGGANTVIGLAEGYLRVFNTDVAGITRALAEHGLEHIRHAVLLGGGATAHSAIVAIAELGAESVDVRLRDPGKTTELIELGRRLGLVVHVDRLDPEHAERAAQPAELLVSTLPAKAVDEWASHYGRLAPVVFDVAYEPWPSSLATSATAAGGRVVSGLEMLLQQALIQVRIFVSGDPFEPLEEEERVLAAMRNAL